MLEQLAGVVVTVTRIDRLARSTFREVIIRQLLGGKQDENGFQSRLPRYRQRNGMRHRHTIVEVFLRRGRHRGDVSARTTQLYDRHSDQVSLDRIERIVL